MHQSIPPVPIPRATPGHLYRFSVPGAGHFVDPGMTSREFDTQGFKTVKSRQDACFYSFAMEAFVGKDMDFMSQ